MVQFMTEELEIEDDWMVSKLKRMRENTLAVLKSKKKRSYAEFS